MKQMGIRACWVKHYTVTTRSSCLYVMLVSMLRERFNPSSPDAIWCSDITYIWTTEGFMYLASIMDLFFRKIIAWDNACIESFHALIKREWLNRFKIENYQQAYVLVFEYINTFYNTVRIHSHCNYNVFEELYANCKKKSALIAG